MIAITMCVRHWLGALHSSLYIETGHKESFLPFFPSLVHSSILHLPFVSPFLFAHFHFYARHYFSLTPIPSFLLFISFPFFHFFSICFVRASLLPPPHPSSSSRLRSSSPPSLHRTLSVPCPAFPFHSLARSLARSPSRGQPRSLSLAPTLFLCSISFAGKSEATGSYVACGFTNRARLLNRFLSLVLLAGGTQQRRARCSLRARFPLSEKSRPNDSAGESS